MSKPYDKLSDEELLRNLSENPPDTPHWIRSNAEMQRRIAERRERRGIAPPRAREFTDPFTEVTRRERRLLLIVDLVVLAVVLGGLVPTEVETLGIKVQAPQRLALLWLLFGTNLYLAVTFVIYGWNDLSAWQQDHNSYIKQKADEAVNRFEQFQAHATRRGQEYSDKDLQELVLEEWPFERKLQNIRSHSDFWIPVLISIFSLATLLWQLARAA